MAPQRKVTLKEVSIPKEYSIPGASLFTQTWWKKVARTDFFWTQLSKYVSKGTLNRRMSLEIKVDAEKIFQENAKSKEQKRRNQSKSVPSTTGRASTAPEVDDNDNLATAAPAQGQIRLPPERPTSTHRRARCKGTATSYVQKVECTECGEFKAVQDMTMDDDGNYVCESCGIFQPNSLPQAGSTITISIPGRSADLDRHLRETTAARELTEVDDEDEDLAIDFEPPRESTPLNPEEDVLTKDATASQNSTSIKVEEEENIVEATPSGVLIPIEIEDEDEERAVRSTPPTESTGVKIKEEHNAPDAEPRGIKRTYGNGEVVTTEAGTYLVYMDENGARCAVKTASAPSKKQVKIELDD